MELLEKIRQAADTLTPEETKEVLRYIKKSNRIALSFNVCDIFQNVFSLIV